MSYLSSGCEAVCFRIVFGKRYVMPVIAGNTGGAGSTDQHTLSAEAADWMLRVSVREEKKRKKIWARCGHPVLCARMGHPVR